MWVGRQGTVIEKSRWNNHDTHNGPFFLSFFLSLWKYSTTIWCRCSMMKSRGNFMSTNTYGRDGSSYIYFPFENKAEYKLCFVLLLWYDWRASCRVNKNEKERERRTRWPWECLANVTSHRTSDQVFIPSRFELGWSWHIGMLSVSMCVVCVFAHPWDERKSAWSLNIHPIDYDPPFSFFFFLSLPLRALHTHRCAFLILGAQPFMVSRIIMLLPFCVCIYSIIVLS